MSVNVDGAPANNWIVGKAAGSYTLTQARNALVTIQQAMETALGIPRPCDLCGLTHEKTPWDIIIAKPDGTAYALHAVPALVNRWPNIKSAHPALQAMVTAGAIVDPAALDSTWIGFTVFAQ